MSLLKKLASETAIYGMSHILSRILLFVVFTIYLTRRFDGETMEYGIYSDMYSYATILLTILVFRMDTAFFRYGRHGNLDKAFNTGFWAVLIFCMVVLLVLLPNIDKLSILLQYEESPHYIKWFAYILVLDAITALIFAKFRLQGRPYKFMFYKMANVVLTIVTVLSFLEILPKYFPDTMSWLNLKLGVSRQIDYVFFSNLLASAAIIVLMIPEFAKLKFEIDKELLKKMFWYSLPLVAVGIAGNINQAFAAPLQKHFLGGALESNLSNAGVYAAAAKLAILLNLFTTAFNYAAEPFFFNNADKDNSTIVYGKVALAFTIVSCLVTLGLIFYIDIVISLLGDSYRKGIYVVPILLFAYVFLGLYYNVSIWYKLKDKTIIGAWISFVGAAITIGISLLLLPKIGAVASAWSALACYVTMVILCYIIGQKYMPIAYPIKKILGYIAITLGLSTASLYLRVLDLSTIVYYGIVTTVFIGVVAGVYKREWTELTKV